MLLVNGLLHEVVNCCPCVELLPLGTCAFGELVSCCPLRTCWSVANPLGKMAKTIAAEREKMVNDSTGIAAAELVQGPRAAKIQAVVNLHDTVEDNQQDDGDDDFGKSRNTHNCACHSLNSGLSEPEMEGERQRKSPRRREQCRVDDEPKRRSPRINATSPSGDRMSSERKKSKPAPESDRKRKRAADEQAGPVQTKRRAGTKKRGGEPSGRAKAKRAAGECDKMVKRQRMLTAF